MDYLIASIGHNAEAKDIAFTELKRLVGTDCAADLLIGGLASASKHYSLVPETKWFKLSKEERLALPASVALVAGIAEDLNVTQFQHPFEAIRQTEKHFAKSQDSLNTNQLRSESLAGTAVFYGRKTELTEAGRCLVCQVRFRGSRVCSRCGADLEPLMTLMVKSWRLRESARAALAAGQLAQASMLLEKAQQIQGAPAGVALKVISSLLR